MKCKNCQTDLNSADNYCCYCGAKVINQRITLNHLISDFISSLGWDNMFWTTLRDLVLRPHLVFDKYLSGTRKKYSNPFSFFAIVTTVTVLLIGFYTNEMIDMTTNYNFSQVVTPAEATSDTSTSDQSSQQANDVFSGTQEEVTRKVTEFIVKYYSYFSFVFLPLYAFIAFLVFGKPNNYAEHLVINAYISGLVSVAGLFMFILGIATKTNGIYFWGQYAVTFIYYPYAYKRYRNYSARQITLKILKFVFVALMTLIAFVLVGVVVGIIMAILKS